MAVKTELKLKARIENVDEVKKRIKKLAKLVGQEKVADFFYVSEVGKVDNFRIRRSGRGAEIVVKIPVYTGEIQKSEEYRFRADDVEDFAKLIELFGYELVAIVKKKCDVYEKEWIGIRISNVERIGNYVELTGECGDECTGEEEEKMKDEMRGLLKEILGDDAESAIDNRYYGIILKEMDEGDENGGSA